jgi:hypothetical protein
MTVPFLWMVPELWPLRTSFFWIITQQVVVISYRLFRPVRVELLHGRTDGRTYGRNEGQTNRQTEKHDEGNRHYSQVCERAKWVTDCREMRLCCQQQIPVKVKSGKETYKGFLPLQTQARIDKWRAKWLQSAFRPSRPTCQHFPFLPQE